MWKWAKLQCLWIIKNNEAFFSSSELVVDAKPNQTAESWLKWRRWVEVWAERICHCVWIYTPVSGVTSTYTRRPDQKNICRRLDTTLNCDTDAGGDRRGFTQVLESEAEQLLVTARAEGQLWISNIFRSLSACQVNQHHEFRHITSSLGLSVLYLYILNTSSFYIYVCFIFLIVLSNE